MCFSSCLIQGTRYPYQGGRSSCPQRSRGRDATCPRENNDLCPRTRTVHVSDPATDSPQSRTVHVHEQSLTSVSPRPQTCPRIGRVRVQASAWTVGSQALATDANCPWTVHGFEFSTSRSGHVLDLSATCDCPEADRIADSSCPCGIRSISRSCPHHSRLCPHLIPP